MGGHSQILELTGLTISSRSETCSTNSFRFRDLLYDIRVHQYELVLLSDGEIHLERKEQCARDPGDQYDEPASIS
jgi:hypothetical protein